MWPAAHRRHPRRDLCPAAHWQSYDPLESTASGRIRLRRPPEYINMQIKINSIRLKCKSTVIHILQFANTHKHHKVCYEQTVLDELPAAVHAGAEPHVVLRSKREREWWKESVRVSVRVESVYYSLSVCVRASRRCSNGSCASNA